MAFEHSNVTPHEDIRRDRAGNSLLTQVWKGGASTCTGSSRASANLDGLLKPFDLRVGVATAFSCLVVGPNHGASHCVACTHWIVWAACSVTIGIAVHRTTTLVTVA